MSPSPVHVHLHEQRKGDAVGKARGLLDPESRKAIEDHYRSDVERINHEQDRKIEKIRAS